jgi:hypothetical protein
MRPVAEPTNTRPCPQCCCRHHHRRRRRRAVPVFFFFFCALRWEGSRIPGLREKARQIFFIDVIMTSQTDFFQHSPLYFPPFLFSPFFSPAEEFKKDSAWGSCVRAWCLFHPLFLPFPLFFPVLSFGLLLCAKMSTKVFVGNLSFKTREPDLAKFFEEVGPV